MIHAAFRDLVWRRRRYLISVIGCGLVFGMSLLMSGLSNSFGLELDQTIQSLGAKGFVLADGVSGPFSSITPFPETEVPEGAVPMAFLYQAASSKGSPEPLTVALFGLPMGSAAEPQVVSGRERQAGDEVLVNDTSDYETGSVLTIGGLPVKVVGRVDGLSLNGGNPGVVVDLPLVQEHFLSGAPLVTTAVVTGAEPQVPDGLQMGTVAEAREDGLRVVASAKESISFVTWLLWGVAALIIGSVVYLSAIERTRDFAVFKATGTSTSAMGIGLAMQAVILALAAALVGMVLGLALAPTFPMTVSISVTAVLLLLAVALGVGLFASAFGLRRAMSVEPALAFGGAA